MVEAVLAEPAYDVIAVEMSSFQLHWTRSVRPYAAAVLNVAPDHVDWHGSLDGVRRGQGPGVRRAEIACVYNVADPATERLVREADVAEGCRAIGFTLGVPGLSMLGVVEDVLVDRAFVPDRERSAAELASVHDVVPFAPHNVANALAAAALARAFGVPPAAVRDGLRAFRPDGHRIALVAERPGSAYVDDSKATNPHAAAASLAAYDSRRVDRRRAGQGRGLRRPRPRSAPRLRGVVLLGRDRAVIADALARHAPEVPVVDVVSTDTGVMDEVVRAAAGWPPPGDTVLLAPACASMDLFRDYAARGDAFAEAVGRLPGGPRR
jgi:UDP-N-acetylmuramoylalanine--D-glutamate ligase